MPLAQTVDYKDELMTRIEVQSHFVRGLLLVTNAQPGALEPLMTKTLSEVDQNLTITSVRTMQQQVDLQFDQERSDRVVACPRSLIGEDRPPGHLSTTIVDSTRCMVAR